MGIIDSHLHFWKLDNPGHQWPDAEWPRIHYDFEAADLRAAAEGCDLQGAVLVQSQPDDRDTDWMLALAADDPLVKAVVGWVDLEAPTAPDRIAALARHPKLRGLRPMLQGIPDTDWIMRDALTPAIEAMVAHGLRFDALAEPRHLAVLARFAERWPTLPIVIDHAAKPQAARGELDPWRTDIARLAENPAIYCKLSGLRTEQTPGQAAEALRPYVKHLVTIFSARLMWGSDWPVLLHAGDRYADWIIDAERLAAPTDQAARDTLFSGAATRFYDLAL